VNTDPTADQSDILQNIESMIYEYAELPF